MDTERWVPVPVEGFEDLYEVSSLGQVRRSAPLAGRDQGRALTPYVSPRGSLVVTLHAHGRARCPTVARIVAGAFLPPCPWPGGIPRHRDGDRSNCRAENLFWAPAGTRTPGSGRPRKLTQAQRKEVVALREVVSGAEVARRYGVTRSLICQLWKTPG
jgi:hypothetical protein